MLWTILGNAALIFALRVTDVSMGTVRTKMIMWGHRKWATLIGFVEVTIWVLAISRVIANLDTFWNVIAYSGGFASGTMLGMWIEEKLAMGHAEIHMISTNHGKAIAEHLREAGFGATMLKAEGQSGPVSLINVVVPRKSVPKVIRSANEIDAKAFITVEDARKVMRGYGQIVK